MPPFIVVQGKNITADWFTPEMEPGTYVEASECGFTSDVTYTWRAPEDWETQVGRFVKSLKNFLT